MEKLVESFSGVRGIYGKSLTDEIVRKYATVYAQYLMDGNKKVRVVIGRDTRASGKKLQKIFTQKFLKFGFNVIDVGTAGTPAVELGVREYKACGGVMITASHNEPEFNGFKMLGSDGAILLVKESERIIKKVHTFKNTHDIATKRGKLINKKNDLDNRYVRYILKIIGYEAVREIRKSNFKLVADPNGGPVREVIEKLFRKLNVEIVGVNMKEGKFMRQVEPTVKSLAKLRSVVKNKKADFGFGLDLDADRMEIVLANGKMVSGNEMMALGVESVLSTKAKGQKVVVNLPTSHLVHEIIKKYKGNISEVDVGETNVVTKMTALGSKVGGEGSCGGLIVSPSKCRDGLLSVAVILALMARQNISLIEILE